MPISLGKTIHWISHHGDGVSQVGIKDVLGALESAVDVTEATGLVTTPS